MINAESRTPKRPDIRAFFYFFFMQLLKIFVTVLFQGDRIKTTYEAI